MFKIGLELLIIVTAKINLNDYESLVSDRCFLKTFWNQ